MLTMLEVYEFPSPETLKVLVVEVERPEGRRQVREAVLRIVATEVMAPTMQVNEVLPAMKPSPVMVRRVDPGMPDLGSREFKVKNETLWVRRMRSAPLLKETETDSTAGPVITGGGQTTLVDVRDEAGTDIFPKRQEADPTAARGKLRPDRVTELVGTPGNAGRARGLRDVMVGTV